MLTEEFIERLTQILNHTGMNAAAFADKIGIQRSSISHLLSGRNKPSLDFILKILDTYPEFDLYWLLTGKGNLLFDNKISSNNQTTPPTDAKKASDKNDKKSDANSSIEKMIILYKDGSFSEHFPK